MKSGHALALYSYITARYEAFPRQTLSHPDLSLNHYAARLRLRPSHPHFCLTAAQRSKSRAAFPPPSPPSPYSPWPRSVSTRLVFCNVRRVPTCIVVPAQCNVVHSAFSDSRSREAVPLRRRAIFDFHFLFECVHAFSLTRLLLTDFCVSIRYLPP